MQQTEECKCGQREKLEKKESATYMIGKLADSLRSLATRPGSLSQAMSSKFDNTSRKILDKINELLEEV